MRLWAATGRGAMPRSTIFSRWPLSRPGRDGGRHASSWATFTREGRWCAQTPQTRLQAGPSCFTPAGSRGAPGALPAALCVARAQHDHAASRAWEAPRALEGICSPAGGPTTRWPLPPALRSACTLPCRA